MEVALGPVISALLKMGAPWIITAVFLVLFITERKRKEQLADKLYDLGIVGVKKDAEIHAALENVCRNLVEIRRKQ